MDKKEIKLEYKYYENDSEMNDDDSYLLNEAKEALKSSYSPYSQFPVGAAVRLVNGEIIRGSNQENSAYPSGLCAERVAIFAAGSLFPGVAIDSIAIAASSPDTESPISPCGACRQVMLEYEDLYKHNIRVIMHGETKGIMELSKVSDLLPFGFTNKRLNK